MANPTPPVVEWIRGQVVDWAPSDAEISASLNSVMVSNPIPSPDVLPPMTAKGLFDFVSVESQKRLAAWPTLRTLREDIRAGDRSAVVNWIGLLAAGEIVSTEEAGEVIDYLTTAAPDVAHPVEVPHTLALFGRLIDADDVAVARVDHG